VNPVILRPNLALQREIAAWCLQNDVPYTHRPCTQGPAEASIAGRTTRRSCSRQLFAAAKGLGKLLTHKSPHHPFESYQYATK